MDYLGTMPAMTPEEVESTVEEAWTASKIWKNSSFGARRKILRILLKYIIENQEVICRVSARDSGKPMVDAAFAEVLCTCEKIWWLLREAEMHLKAEYRTSGIMMFYKRPRVEFVPVGVVAAIVPWNYPFHNILNPITTAIMTGNAIVVKVSEHASWSVKYYASILEAALEAGGAPKALVRFVTGYREAGEALVSAKLGKIIFVGSTAVGRSVMLSAAKRLTPVTLELGGKDSVIICDDVDLNQVVQTCLRAAYQACGANCMGGERFIVHEAVYEKFVERTVSVVKQIRQGPPLGANPVDCGAICMPGLAQKVHGLIQEAVSQGAKVEIGGVFPEGSGQFYPPTVLTGVHREMRIWKEEVFGPVMVIVPFKSDSDAIELANDCAFGLGTNIFSNNHFRANSIASQVNVGMASINDFATTYMCQSLPFGGVKESGFDNFGGIEGLRGMCTIKAVCEDRYPWLMKTELPPLLQYPVKDKAFEFVSGLTKMFYYPGLNQRLQGLGMVIKYSLSSSIKKKKDKEE
eukprot:g6711.t1